MSAGTLIIGASLAGVQVAVSMRDAGYEEHIVLIGAEVSQPYSRPPLSKAFLAGKANVDSLSLRTPRFYADKGIDLVTAERVVGLSLSGDGSAGGTATTDRGRLLELDKLALTVGTCTRRLDLPGADLAGVCLPADDRGRGVVAHAALDGQQRRRDRWWLHRARGGRSSPW